MNSKAYFEIFQVDYVCEVKLLVTYDLYKGILQKHNIDPESVEREVYKGMISDYLYNNVKLFDEKGYKLNLISYELLTQNDLTDQVEIKLNYSKQVADIYWVINTMFFDYNPAHLNYHRFNDGDDNYRITSMEKPNFSVVAVKKQYTIWIVLILIVLLFVSYLIYKTSV